MTATSISATMMRICDVKMQKLGRTNLGDWSILRVGNRQRIAVQVYVPILWQRRVEAHRFSKRSSVAELPRSLINVVQIAGGRPRKIGRISLS
jgi:hypothetical protein